jgi:hypothetical protein
MKLEAERNYLEVIAKSAERAKILTRRNDDPVDLKPAPGNLQGRVWGFPIIKRTRVRTAH